MGSCYSCDHIAEDRIHTDITTCTIEEHNKSTALERSVIDYWGHKYVLLNPNPHPLFETFGTHEGFLSNQ